MQFGPVGVEQALGQVLKKLGHIGGQAIGLAAGGERSNDLSAHNPLRCFLLLPVVRSSLARRMERPRSKAIVGRNLLKTSTNSPAISTLSVTVAEKLRLVLTTDATKTHLCANRFRWRPFGLQRGSD
jgi:hypothetical protein